MMAESERNVFGGRTGEGGEREGEACPVIYLKRCIFFCRRELIRNDQLIVSSLSIDKIELTGEGSQHARE